MHQHPIDHLFDTDGPVLIFGGPYSNVEATRAMRAVSEQLNIPAQRCICTGDVVAYCANPCETIAEIRDWGCAVLAGNCEKQLAAGAMDCGCGFEENSTCDLLSVGWYNFARPKVDAAARTWMAGLPEIMSFSHQGQRAVVTHGGFTDVSRFLWSNSPEAHFQEELRCLRSAQNPGAAPPDYVFSGHSGIAFQRSIAGCAWVNAGVIGMPPNDGTTATQYAVLSDGAAHIGALRYDHIAAARAMRREGLVQGYDQGLLSGIWPSQNILPPALRRSQ